MIFSSNSSSQVSSIIFSIAKRAFSTSNVCSKEYAHVVNRKQKQYPVLKVGMSKHFLPKFEPKFPKYPYGDSTLFKQSNTGLYGGKIIQFGNQISEFRNKSRRSWLPNVSRHKLWSEALARDINIKTTSRVLRTITKEGGIDRYLTKDKPSRIKELGPTGWKLRYRVLSKLELQERARPKIIDEIQISDDKTIPVFFKHVSKSGAELNITVGKRKLLKSLYDILSLKNDEKASTYLKFVNAYGKADYPTILGALEQHSFDLSNVSVKN